MANVDLERLQFYLENYSVQHVVRLGLSYIEKAEGDEDLISEIAFIMGEAYFNAEEWDSAGFWYSQVDTDPARQKLNLCRKNLGLPYLE